MNTLLSENLTAQEWCQEVVSKQEQVVYNSLTSQRDFNHVVKEHIQEIINFLKVKEHNNQTYISKLKEALTILIDYLKSHEVWKPSKEKPLTDEELDVAYSNLYIDKFVKCDRKFNDPPIRGQNYALFSFNPTNGSNPDKDGIYGFIKMRGAFNRLEEAQEKSKELIQYFSANQIFLCEVGTPIPLQNKLNDKDSIIEVYHPDEEEKYKELMKEQGLKEKKEMEEVKHKAELLLQDVKKDPTDVDPLQHYIQLKYKKADLCSKYIVRKNEMSKIKEVVIKVREELINMDKTHPNLKQEYMDHYNKTCEERGIDQTKDEMALMIKEFMMDKEPVEIDF
jgi:hypothetical protein